MVRATKETTLNIRVSLHEKEVIAKAAAIKKSATSKFILENAYEAACEVISGQTNFQLNNKQWTKFCQALDAPTRDIPTLKRLLTKPGIFDE